MPLSYSQLVVYRRCPRQYEYAVVKKLHRGISPEESFGSSVHNCLKRWGELEIRDSGSGSGSDNKQLGMFEEEREANSQLLTANSLIELWHQCFIVDTYKSRVEADFHRQRGEKLMNNFFEWSHLRSSSFAKATEDRSSYGGQGSGMWEVVAVEKSFSLIFDGTKLSGRIDRIEKFRIQNLREFRIRVIDYKTSQPRSQEEVDADLQLSIYALAVKELFDEPCSELSFLYISEDEVVERVTQRSKSQLADARKQILSLKGNIESKEFHPTPSAPVCKRCPFKGVCDVAAV